MKRQINNMRFIVRDWLIGEIWEFDNFSEAKNLFNKIKKECENNECDIQLYEIIDEYMSDNVKSI